MANTYSVSWWGHMQSDDPPLHNWVHGKICQGEWNSPWMKRDRDNEHKYKVIPTVELIGLECSLKYAVWVKTPDSCWWERPLTYSNSKAFAK